MDSERLRSFYSGKTVLVTGHTGFKGSWLTHILLSFGARVIGVSLPPASEKDIFVVTGLATAVSHHEFDIRNAERLIALVSAEKPDVVFHLAAQPLVRQSYAEPQITMSTNVMGTVNVLEAIRLSGSVKAGVIITTDKVYENKEWLYGYRENDPLGGYDPYSASKAAADIVTDSYRRSFFNENDYGEKHNTLIAIARAGNVIGQPGLARLRVGVLCRRSGCGRSGLAPAWGTYRGRRRRRASHSAQSWCGTPLGACPRAAHGILDARSKTRRWRKGVCWSLEFWTKFRILAFGGGYDQKSHRVTWRGRH